MYCIDVVTLYTPPSLNFIQFISDCSNILQQTACQSSSGLACLGDFNVHIDTENDVKAKALKRLLDEFGLYQYITFPTHVKGRTLNLVIGDNRHPQIIRNTRTLFHGSVKSDHFPVCLNIMFKKPGKVNTLRPRRNERHFAEDIFKRIFFNENVWISIKMSLKFVSNDPINNIPALVHIMARRRSGDKPLSEPMMVSLPTHICLTRPQWIKRIVQYRKWSSLDIKQFKHK